MTNATITTNFKYYVQNSKDLWKKYPNQFLLIVNKEVLGAYDNPLAAYKGAIGIHKLNPGSFVIQKTSKGDESYHLSVTPVISNGE